MDKTFFEKKATKKAKQYLASLRRVNPQSSQLAELEAQLSRLSMPPTREWKTIKAHKDGKKRAICWPDCLAFSPDGQFLLSGSFDNTLKLFNINTRKLVRTFEGHSDDVNSVAFSPDGQRVLSGSKDKTIKLWNLSTGQLIHTFKGHSKDVNSVVFSPDGSFIASGSDDDTVKLWDVSSGNLICTLIGHKTDVWSVTFSPEGRLASGDRDGVIKLWR